MPLSDADTTPEVSQPGFGVAVAAEVLYLTNLLLVPGLAFLVLIWLYLRERQAAPPLARCHLAQVMSASIWAGVMLVVVNLLIILLGGYDSPNTWMVVIIYFTTVHATLVLLGTLGLARAMAGKHYHYPLVGRPCAESS
jgi:uncharacterized Tic20 family protein